MKPSWGALVRVIAVAVVAAGCATSSKHATSPTTAATRSTTTVGSTTSPPASTAPASTAPASTAPASTAPASTAPATTVAQPSSGPPSSSNAGPAAATTPVAIRPCATRQLSAILGSPNGAAGTIYYNLDLRNVSSINCSVRGYPGVSFVAGTDGHQVGNPAERVGGPTPLVMLAPQRSAVALLAVVEAANYGPPCQLTPVLGFRIYPPDQTAALYVPSAQEACANTHYTTLRIEPLQP